MKDTSGAYPGVDAEERGQAEAIARSTDCCLSLGVPLVSVVIGEGGSGGAIAIATGNAVLMLEHAIYSVISPEGAASILWRDPARNKDAAAALKITAQDLKRLGVIDDIIPEPQGGAHRQPAKAIANVSEAIHGLPRRLHRLAMTIKNPAPSWPYKLSPPRHRQSHSVSAPTPPQQHPDHHPCPSHWAAIPAFPE